LTTPRFPELTRPNTAPDALDATRREALTEMLAERIHRAGLSAPAIFFLEMHKPLAFLGGQMLFAAQPFLGRLTGDEPARELASFFEEPANVEKLIERLEKKCQSSKAS
jgi:hypothetical protein